MQSKQLHSLKSGVMRAFPSAMILVELEKVGEGVWIEEQCLERARCLWGPGESLSQQEIRRKQRRRPGWMCSALSARLRSLGFIL